ncbi:MAG TPA: universal stress protein, partial [Microlunatus sp.]|nr:universal stress protein [Microlunatus sp.]
LVVGLGPGDGIGADGADDRGRIALSEIGAAADHLALQLEPAQRVHTSISERSGVDALLAASTSAGVVVLQRRRLGPLARIRGGSTSALVAARATCPVLLVHPDDPVPASDGTRPGILVGVDPRGHAAHAIAEAFAEASWRNVPLTAVLAWEAPGPTFVPPGPSETEFLHASAAAELAAQLAGHREQYPDVEVHQSVLWGRPVPVLADLSAGYELLVVARHTEGRRGRGNLGSETRRLIEEAHCSVLITPTSRPTPVARHRHSAMTGTPAPPSP